MKLSGSDLTALAKVFEPVCATADSGRLADQLLGRYRKLCEDGAGDEVNPDELGVGFRLALLLDDWSRAFTLEAVEALAKELDASSAPIVALAAVRRLTSPSQVPAEVRARGVARHAGDPPVRHVTSDHSAGSACGAPYAAQRSSNERSSASTKASRSWSRARSALSPQNSEPS